MKQNIFIEEKIIFPKVPITVTASELKTYLEKGSHESPRSEDKSLKLSSVGFIGKSLGGKINSSLNGLKALDTTNTSGRSINRAIISRKINVPIFPPMLRYALAPTLLFIASSPSYIFK